MQVRRLVLSAMVSFVLACTVIVGSPPTSAQAAVTAVPRPDHVVVLILENHSTVNILGNADAPYINSLANTEANMTSSYAITHPSQPNYIALFSGALNGVTDNSCPNVLTADNLGAQLINSGRSFVGYSEDLPSVGFTGCGSGAYARKHNPWVNFTNVPSASNRPLTDFPSDYANLPAVSMVVPNLQHDMHDGTIAQGDAWVHDHLDGYVQWAKTHNSLFVLTFDEDDNQLGNHIPTILAGQQVQPGQYGERIDHYNVLRTVQDAFGLPGLANSANATPLLDVWKAETAAPTARFTVSCVALTCSADGSASSAATGASITQWNWAWGDGSVTTSPSTSSHTYPAAGDFTVTLTVTDDQSRSGQATRGVSPRSDTAPDVFASDAFARTVTAGLGTADLGGAWSTVGGAANFSVSSGAASLVHQKAGAALGASLPSARSTDTDLRMTVATDPLPGANGLYLTFVGRRVAANLEYQGGARVRSDGTVAIKLSALTGTATAVSIRSEIVAAGVRVTAGSPLRTRLQVTGTTPTSIQLKVWTGATEPAGWQLAATDSTPALQATGSIGLTTYLSSGGTVAPVTAKISALSASRTAAPPANRPPTAAFTETATNLSVAYDGSTSSDPDGAIAGYAWDFGDSSPAGSTPRPTHVYGAAGTYHVRLTVTDDRGLTGTALRDVTVSQPATTVLASDDFARSLASGWGSADVGGAWTTGSSSSFAVSGGAGSITIKTAGSGPSIALNGISSNDVDLQLTTVVDKAPTGGGIYLSAAPRRVAGVGEYLAKVHLLSGGSVRVALIFINTANVETAVVGETAVPGLTVGAGDPLQIRVQAGGATPTTLRAKVWKAGGTQPATWAVTTSDTRAGMQAAGSVGVRTYVSSSSTNAPVVVRVSQLRAVRASQLQ